MPEKPDQGDVVAQLATASSDLAAWKAQGKTAAVLISEPGTLTAEVARLTGETQKLSGDNAKLVAGATVPADLVSAGNAIFSLTVERDNLKAVSASVEVAVAKEVAKLGFTGKETRPAGLDKAKVPTLTEKVLARKGVKTLAELAAKGEEARATARY